MRQTAARRRRLADPADPAERAAVTVLVVVCAASAGAHAGLVPEHLHESRSLGISFILATVLLLAVGAAVALHPEDRRVAQVAALLLAGLVASWAASRTTGLPVLAPHPESVDVIGLVTKLVEAFGLACAWRLSQPVGGRRPPTSQEVSR